MDNPLVARAVGRQGRVLATQDGATVEGLMAWADREQPDAWSIQVRTDRTSDGTVWGPGRGRVVASREGGRWSRY